MRPETVNPVQDRSFPGFASWLISFAVTMLLTCGFMTMLSTAFKLGFEIGNIILWTGISALIISIVHVINNKIASIITLALPPVSFALMLIFDIFQCREGLKAFLSYVQSYVIYALPGDYGEPGQATDLIFTLIAMYNLIPISVTSFTLIKRKFIPLSLLFYGPIFFFSVANTSMLPDQAPCICTATGVLLAVLAHAFRKKKRKNGDRLVLITSVPAFILALTISLIFPMKGYKQDNIARRILQNTRGIIKLTLRPDNPVYEMLDTAENGLQDPDSMIELISSKQLVALYPSDKDLTKVGPFNPGEGQVMGIYKKLNEKYADEYYKNPVYTLYLKVESLDKYEDNRLTNDNIRVKPYKDDVEPFATEGLYSIQVYPLIASSADIIPLYTDIYYTPDCEISQVGLYGTTSTEQGIFASSTVPVQGDIYTDEYIEKYVYGTCLEVPERTRDALTLSKKLPGWYMECLYGLSSKSDCDKVRAITSYVSYLHPYDRDTEYPPDGVDFVPWFVTDAKSGICVHYAATTVILLRMAGIPARYCSGFSYSRCYPNTQSLVYNEDAHAWFEFFVPGYGWIMGDSTPGMAYRASSFNIEAVSAAYPEIEDAKFARTRELITDIAGNNTPTPEPVDETDPSSEDETSETSETEETTVQTNEQGETIPPVSLPDPSDPSSGIEPDGSSAPAAIEDPVDWDAVFEVLGNVLRVLVTVLIVAVILFLIRFGYVSYWRVKFSVKNVGEKIIAYYHYYSFMHRLLRKHLPAPSIEIVDKVAFSREKITKKDLNSFIGLSSKSLRMLTGRLPKFKRFIMSLLEVEIKKYK